MSVDTLVRPEVLPEIVVAPRGGEHVHDRTCWWDLTQCRWAGPSHPPVAPRRRD